jgi:hypothetical protein
VIDEVATELRHLGQKGVGHNLRVSVFID